jgi:hypothetical protein
LRVYFPTRNDNGVRDLSRSVTLGGYLYNDYRAPAEPAAKAAMNPVNLGAVQSNGTAVKGSISYWRPPQPVFRRPVCDSTAGGGPCGTQISPPVVLPPPVSAQSSPTPVVTVPPAPPSTSVLVTSGGGTASPAPAAASAPASTVVTSAPGLTDQVAAWLSGTTPIFSWNVPNALLAAGVILGAAVFMGGGKKK